MEKTYNEQERFNGVRLREKKSFSYDEVVNQLSTLARAVDAQYDHFHNEGDSDFRRLLNIRDAYIRLQEFERAVPEEIRKDLSNNVLNFRFLVPNRISLLENDLRAFSEEYDEIAKKQGYENADQVIYSSNLNESYRKNLEKTK